MGRRTKPDEFVRIVHKIHRILPETNVGADVIVGFPGETEKDFSATVEVVRNAVVNYLHIFPFSPRPLTPAAEMQPQIPARVVRERVQMLRRIDAELRHRYISAFLSRVLELLVEKVDNGEVKGITSNYIKVRAWYEKGWSPQPNQIVSVKLTKTKGKICLGEIVSPAPA